MISIKNIVKDYQAGDTIVHALRDININFRKSEFVSILGPSGCGKTTLLNIIGGLDKYTSGDIVVNGKSTKEFKDKDWDAYRSHYIGFVFQSYNLIPHLSVLENVELALTIAGTSKKERRAKAIKALNQVGLAEQIKK
ncbi:MAG: ABC transporter ATP-binding protein, partial [Clostridia bacterium]